MNESGRGHLVFVEDSFQNTEGWPNTRKRLFEKYTSVSV